MEVNESWIQVISLFLANAALIVWFRAESRSDWRHMDNKMEVFRSENRQIIQSIHDEMRDFHERLLEIEMQKQVKSTTAKTKESSK